MTVTIARRASRLLPAVLAALALPAAAHGAALSEAPDGAIVSTGGAGATSVVTGMAADGRVRFSPGFDDEITAVPPACDRAEDDPYLARRVVEPAGLRVVMGAAGFEPATSRV